ncbi:carbohydrate ABC transporter permease [Microbacterium karelineae]|uniref:carbohydrate ABC transporter permease n=1 Tax=Microbacterium karelineae TaxID=2654283 RepID=UPI0012E9BC1C|nr:carbohydrate ABC transporter permease [Microbacterium karelineae]
MVTAPPTRSTYALTVPGGGSRPRRRATGRWRRAVLPTTFLWVLAVLMAFPLLWFLLSSFKPGSELFSYPLSFLPREWTLDAYAQAFERLDFFRYLANSAIVSTVSTVVTVFLCATTGYALAKYRNPWLSVLGLCILSMTMLPGEVILNPLFIVIRDLGMYNSLLGVIVPSVVTPTGVFMFRQFFVSIPDELLQAARIDGASEYGIFFRIMMPLARPIMLTLAIVSFQWRWNDYILPLIVLGDPQNYTLQIALRSLVGAENIEWSILLAASVLSMIPLVALYLVFQRYITSSNINAGLKD